MTKREQLRFVHDLLDSIKNDIRHAIQRNEIPTTWDGIELREYIYEKAQRSRVNHLLEGKRGRDYRNTITISPSL